MGCKFTKKKKKFKFFFLNFLCLRRGHTLSGEIFTVFHKDPRIILGDAGEVSEALQMSRHISLKGQSNNLLRRWHSIGVLLPFSKLGLASMLPNCIGTR